MANRRYQTSSTIAMISPNVWDVVVLVIILGLLASLAWGAGQMTVPYKLGEPLSISLSPLALPRYAVSSVLRMFIAMFFSLLITFTLAPLAAKNRQAERFILPVVDIMQSIPVLGLLSITVIGFIRLFPNSLLGPECAAIFAIITSQVWNMIISLYQSLRTVPMDLNEVARMYQLSAWQKFWKVEIPHGLRPLIWNTMVSMSSGWFFVVLSEAIKVSQQNIMLPGIGSYIYQAIVDANIVAIVYAILTMFLIILIYDQLLFRPLLAWAEKFNAEMEEEEEIHESWFFNLLAKTRFLKTNKELFTELADLFINGYKRALPKPKFELPQNLKQSISSTTSIFWNIFLTGVLIGAFIMLFAFIARDIKIVEVINVFYLGLLTTIKVMVLILLASIFWIPIGVWIGLRPKVTLIVQPLIQFLAAFPANLFYPIVAYTIIKYQLNQDIWTMPLMILGTQWYILFNVISGASSIPKEIRLAVKNFGVKGSLWWRKMMLPAIFPNYVTGAMAAAGGCWNASIVAEYVEWGDYTIISTGLGQYITLSSIEGDFPRIALGIFVMCIYVLLFNRLLWRKLFALAQERYTMDA